MTALQQRLTGIEQYEVLFVLIVPAIWSDASKELLIEAAVAVCLLFPHSISLLKCTTNRHILRKTLTHR